MSSSLFCCRRCTVLLRKFHGTGLLKTCSRMIYGNGGAHGVSNTVDDKRDTDNADSSQQHADQMTASTSTLTGARNESDIIDIDTNQKRAGNQSIAHLFASSPTDRFREDLYIEMNWDVADELKLQSEVDEIDESTVDEAELEFLDRWDEAQLRDVSGLRPLHRWQLHNKVPPMNRFAWQWDRDALRDRYARYGRKSGVNPGVMWMTDQELEEQSEFDQDQLPDFKENLKEAKRLTRQKLREAKEREQEIDRKMAEYPEILAKYLQEQHEEDEAKRLEAEQRERSIEEIKAEFGYYIDIKDKRFKKLLEEREKIQKKAEKEKLKMKKLGTIAV